MESIKERKKRNQELRNEENSQESVKELQNQEIKSEGEPKKKGKKWKVILLILVCILFALAIAGIAIFKYYYNLMDFQVDDNVNQEQEMQVEQDVQPEEEEKEEDPFEGMEGTERAYNIMLLGLDTRNGDFQGRTDSMILFSINPDTKKVVMTSFLRDIYLEIPGHGGNRLNAAYAYGGTDLVSRTFYNNFGISIDNYVIVNFWLVKDVVDAFGGVEIDITADEIRVMNGYLREHNRLLGNPEGTDYLTANDAGVRVLNGSQALAYARIRYIGTDFARTGRQREIVAACIEKMKVMDWKEMNSMLKQFLPNVKTNLSEKDLMTLLFMALDIKEYTVDSMAIPMDDTWNSAQIRGMSVIQINVNANVEAWRNKVMGVQQ